MHEARRRGALLDVTLPVCLYAGSGVMPGVRVSCRGLGAQDGVIAPVMTGKTPDTGARPRPEGHDDHLWEEDSPGLTHGLARLTPRSRTCGRAAGLRTRADGAWGRARRRPGER